MGDRKSIHWAWVILATCFLDLFINYSVRLGYGVILPEMLKSMDLSRTAGGTIFNAYLLTYVSLTPVTGYLTDRLGARRVITTCALILGVGAFFLGSADNLWTACLAFGMTGVGATGMWAPVITVVQRWFAMGRRGLALGILSSGYGLGFATMGLAFPWLLRHFAWRYAWYFLGIGALVMVMANGVLLRSDPESAGYDSWGGEKRVRSPVPADGGGKSRPGLSDVLRHPTFWLIGFSYLAIAYPLYGITTFMVDYARDQMGMPLEKASLLATVHGVCQVAGVLTVLPLSDYVGRKKTILISSTLITACLAGILFTGKSWGPFFILIGVLAVFYGATFPLYGACVGDYFPKEVMGTVIGAWTPFYGVGAISVHWVTGLLRDATGSYEHAFVINAVMAGLGALLMVGVGKGPPRAD